MTGHIKKLIISVLICQAAGIIGSLFNIQAIPTWYANLKKPPFNPPNWVFGPVWILLYFLMGISLFLVWKSDIPGKTKSLALSFFFFQLILNVIWSFFFFFLKNPLAGLVEIVILWIAILATMVVFFPINRLASLLMIPYLLWTGFAAVLNYCLWHLNK